MNDYFVMYGVRDEMWCKHLIEYAQKNYQAHESTVGFENKHIDPQYRKSTVRWLDRNIEHEVRNLIWDMTAFANRMAFGVDINYINDIQFTEYHGSQEEPAGYHWHHDIDWKDPKFIQRKLSFIMFLNHGREYDGGDLEFDEFKHGIEKTPGTVIIFPSFKKHRVTPVYQGSRYSLVSWIEGPKWR